MSTTQAKKDVRNKNIACSHFTKPTSTAYNMRKMRITYV